MLTWIIIILLVLWLLGYMGPTSFRIGGNAVHTLLVIVVILIVLRLLGII
jgi:hypothetical protein